MTPIQGAKPFFSSSAVRPRTRTAFHSERMHSYESGIGSFSAKIPPRKSLKGLSSIFESSKQKRIDRHNAIRKQNRDLQLNVLRGITKPELGGVALDKENLEQIWGSVKDALTSQGFSTYGRKKALGEVLDDIPRSLLKPKVTMDGLVAELRLKRPVLSELGRSRPGWDSVWKDIRPGHGNHRRHIVMSSVMRNSTYRITDMVKGMGTDKVNKLRGDIGKILDIKDISAMSLDDLEKQLVDKMHNHKFNIFMGKGSWNSAIGGLSHTLNDGEKNAIGRIDSAKSFDELEGLMNEWVALASKSSVFGNTSQRDFAVGVIRDLVNNTLSSYDKKTDPADLKDELKEIVTMFHDSTATDISEAPDGKLKRFQNSKLFDIQAKLMAVMTKPVLGDSDIDLYLSTVKEFVESESSQAAEHSINIDALYDSEHDDHSTAMSTLAGLTGGYV